MDGNVLALIALLILLFLGAITFSVLCCCMKNWVAKASAKQQQQQQQHKEPIYGASSMAGGAGVYSHASMLDGGAMTPDPQSPVPPQQGGQQAGTGTDNPLWIDQKYKAYEEQELTMTVFSDQENSVLSGAGGSSSQEQTPAGGESVSRASASHLVAGDAQSNAYATINKLPMAPASRRSLFGSGLEPVDPQLAPYLLPERDYATLEKTPRSPPGPLVPGIHSTPNAYSGGGAGYAEDDMDGNFTINRNGEPELVADLL